ncbi:sigma-70 family RNA polymerase sigma factor [Vagococcus luciliae]|uniref:RNA polymerase subunit sigma n=1 Tax=Vagococcus luciliae TaxID=2920380 RepID=A0ABY5NZV4_9ENTE|nr:sigma-70 family RNA polymerase sigma factor [Vagococcus luciliae]UUV98946.1 hypothetical protein G314FT_11040 [Vagococcus luciliae]
MKNHRTDKEFFEYVYDIYEQKIFYQALSILNNKEQAEDITQEVFEQLYSDFESIKKFNDLHLKKFIIKTTKNKSIDLYRKNNTRIKYLETYKTKKNNNEEDNNVNDYVDKMISEQEILDISKQLKEPYLHVFLYRVYYGLSNKEIAKIMDSKEATVRKQFERAKNIVKKVIGGIHYGKE